MGNPILRQGPASFEAAVDLDKFRLVALDADGKINYSGEAGPVFGAITENARLDHTGPDAVAVHYGVAAVDLTVAGGDASGIKAGSAVFAAANGEVAAEGTVQVGVALADGKGARVATILNGLPQA